MIVRFEARNVCLFTLLALFIFTAGIIANVAHPAALPEPESKPLDYFVVVTGGEVLEGVYADAHTPFLTRALRPLGCRCVGSITVDDRREDIQQALRFATNHAPLVIITGGLGPTPNDITRETISDLTGIALRENADVIASMERRFNQARDKIRPNLRRQALVPAQGRYLNNPAGTAVGLVYETGGPLLIALPGPPRELQSMVEQELIPFLRERFGIRRFGCSVTLRFVGVGQSQIDQTIKEHIVVDPDVVITSLFEGGRVDFTFSVAGNGSEECERLKHLEAEIREHLGEYFYADDGSTLEETVLEQIRARGGSLALVEIGTGGAVATGLNGARTGSSTLFGAYVGPNEAAVARLVGLDARNLPEPLLERTKSLGQAAADKAGGKWVIACSAVSTDAHGPFVWIAYKLGDDSWQTQRLPLRDSSEATRTAARTQILDYVRRRLSP